MYLVIFLFFVIILIYYIKFKKDSKEKITNVSNLQLERSSSTEKSIIDENDPLYFSPCD